MSDGKSLGVGCACWCLEVPRGGAYNSVKRFVMGVVGRWLDRLIGSAFVSLVGGVWGMLASPEKLKASASERSAQTPVF